MKEKRKYVFGPVLSRRLGRSLGIDPVPLKTCTYDCVYCQLGSTPGKTADIKRYSSPEEIAAELKEVLKHVQADYITLSGSGEPTLNSASGELISKIKKITDIPVCVITNGSLLSDSRVRKRLLGADLVVPSLDAGDEEAFQRINRPHNSVSFRDMVDGIEKFSKEFQGKLWLEIMLAAGINDSAEDLKKFLPLIERINPDRIQINTVVRPPACSGIKGVGADKLRQAQKIFGHKAEIIAGAANNHKKMSASPEEVLETIRRRPSTARDISAYLGLNINEAVKHIAGLLEENAVIAETVGDQVYYKPKRDKL